MKILITAFEPFKSYSENISMQVLDELIKRDALLFDHLILPVSYQGSFTALEERYDLSEYDLLIMLGMASKREWINLERRAAHLVTSNSPDNDGVVWPKEKLLGDREYFVTNLNIDQLAKFAITHNLPVAISDDAGGYVCNSTYYRALEKIQQQNLKTRAIFIHLPPFEKISKAQQADSLISMIERLKKINS